MNRDSNVYTFIYASVLVIVVAAVLSFAAMSLKPTQDKNIEVATKTDILKSVNIASTFEDAELKYDKFITDAYIINSKGVKEQGEAFDVELKVEIDKDIADRKLPVFVSTLESGEKKYILPVRGKGLWGPIWGYVALNEDKHTIYGATFAHKSETPGLGAEIEKEFFQVQFKGKQLLENGKVKFAVVKGGAAEGDNYGVDAISGGTITSKGLEDMLLDCLGAYEIFLNN